MSVLLHASRRARLEREGDRVFVVSPRGNRYRVTPSSPEVFSIAAVWLGMTAAQLEVLVPLETLS